jgi:hypothetical protein
LRAGDGAGKVKVVNDESTEFSLSINPLLQLMKRESPHLFNGTFDFAASMKEMEDKQCQPS